MSNTKIKNEITTILEPNLSANCCGTKITTVIKKMKSSLGPNIKLYDTICDACNETANFEWYLLEEILDLNSKELRSNGIVCHDCKQACNSTNDKCVISLIINASGHTRFSRIDKLEIIYI